MTSSKLKKTIIISSILCTTCVFSSMQQDPRIVKADTIIESETENRVNSDQSDDFRNNDSGTVDEVSKDSRFYNKVTTFDDIDHMMVNGEQQAAQMKTVSKMLDFSSTAPSDAVSHEDDVSDSSTNNVIEEEIIDAYMIDEEMTAAATSVPYRPDRSENPLGKWNVGDYMVLPNLPSFVMFGTDYHFYNLPGTPHYRMREKAWTDEIGCRRYKDYYMVGLGSFYTVCIGDCFEITLENGTVFNIILGDGKADCDTDSTNRYTPCDWFGKDCANVLEFIIDKEKMDKKCYRHGGIHYYKKFNSNIASMRYLGRDNSFDWDTYY